MRTDLIVLCFVVLSSTFASSASAQREPIMVLRAESASASVAPHLADGSMALEAPDACEYALPIVGVVLGGAATITGLVGALGSLFVLGARHDDPDSNADAWLGGSAALAVVGALSLGLSIAQLRSLHHRSRDAEEAATGVQVIQFTPAPGGAVLGVSGTY